MLRDKSFNISIETLKDRHLYVLISIVGLLLYVKTVLFSFTYNDDYRLIVMNSELLGHLSNIPKFFTKDVFISIPNARLFFRPLLNISLMLDAQVAGESPSFYHLTNVLLHIACSLLVFVLFRKLYSRRVAAAGAAIIFSVHPLLASSVAWIPGRNDSLFTLFALSSFIFFLRILEKRRPQDFIFHALFLGLALLTKETAVILPVMALLYIVIVRRETREKRLIFGFVLIWLLMISFWWYLRSNVSQNFVLSETMNDSIAVWLSKVPSLVLYIGKAVFPFNLSVFPNVYDNGLWWGAVAMVLLALLMFTGGEKNYRSIVWGMLWFFLFLAPSLLGGNVLLEHRAYCSMVGFLIAVYEFPIVKKLSSHKNIALILYIACVTVFGVTAYVHSEHYRDREAFCTNAYQQSPSLDDSYSNLAGMFIDHGQYDFAEKVILNGLTRNDSMKVVHRLLGDIYASKGENDKAEREYKISLLIEPLHLQTYVSYGKLCLSEGRLDETERLWRTSVAIEPDFILGYYLLANFFLLQRDNPMTAALYAQEIEKRGSVVMPELLSQIAHHPKNRLQNNGSRK